MIEGSDTVLASFANSVFDYDWNEGLALVVDKTKYSASDLEIITNTAAVPVVMPPQPNVCIIVKAIVIIHMFYF